MPGPGTMEGGLTAERRSRSWPGRGHKRGDSIEVGTVEEEAAQPSQNLPLANPEAAKGFHTLPGHPGKTRQGFFFFSLLLWLWAFLCLLGFDRRWKEERCLSVHKCSVDWGRGKGTIRERASQSLLFTSHTGCFFLHTKVPVVGPFQPHHS